MNKNIPSIVVMANRPFREQSPLKFKIQLPSGLRSRDSLPYRKRGTDVLLPQKLNRQYPIQYME